MKKLICKILGHKSRGLITGFRFSDGSAISRCARCETPIVLSGWRASSYLQDIIAKGYFADDQQRRDLEDLKKTLPPFDPDGGKNIQGYEIKEQIK